MKTLPCRNHAFSSWSRQQHSGRQLFYRHPARRTFINGSPPDPHQHSCEVDNPSREQNCEPAAAAVVVEQAPDAASAAPLAAPAAANVQAAGTDDVLQPAAKQPRSAEDVHTPLSLVEPDGVSSTSAALGNVDPGQASSKHTDTHTTAKKLNPSVQPQPLFGKDLARVWRLAVPLMVNNIAGYALSIVGAIYIGRLGALPLSASVLANSLYNCTGLSLALGLSAGMETLCGQAYGAGAYLRLGVILQRALLVCWTVCLPVVLLWSQSHTLLLQLGQHTEIAALSSRYLILCIPCLFLTTAMECIRKYLQSQRAVKPAMAVAAAVLVASPLYFWLFVEQCQWGLDGAAFAFIACQATTLLGLVGYVTYRAWRLHGKREQTWGGWSRDAFTGWGEYFSYGLPAAAMIAGEWWAYEVIILLAGLLPNAPVALSTMGICLNINAWMYMLPLGLSQAVNTSISNALGAGHAASAKCAFLGGILSGTMMQAVLALIITTQGRSLVSLFTTDPAIITTSCEVLPLLAILVFCDGINSVVSGVLRGSGRQMLGAVCNFWGYFVVGLPLCAFLAFKADMGIHGLWWGVIAGACVQAVVLLTMLLRWDWQQEVRRVQALLQSSDGKSIPQFGH